DTPFTAMPVAVPPVLSKATTYPAALRLSRGTTASWLLWRKITHPLTCPAVLSCADPVSRFGAPLLATTRVAPAASVFKIDEVSVVVPLPNCGYDNGSGKGAPVTS